jgi:tetratricopeptide (TPR) repeat protein
LRKEIEHALRDLNRALSLDPKMAEAWLFRGVAWFDKQDYPRAIADYDEALKLNLRLVAAYSNRGVVRLIQGKITEAEVDLARCRELGGSLKPGVAALVEEVKQQSKKIFPRQPK